MQSIRLLKSKLKSIDSLKSFTGAVRTVSSAKFSRLTAIRKSFDEYAAACKAASKLLSGSIKPPDGCEDRTAYVVFTANKSLCGDYNTELCKYIESIVTKNDTVYVCGRWGETHLMTRFSAKEVFTRSDIPTDGESEAMAKRLISEVESGNISRVILVYQRFVNMLKHEPTQKQLLPFETDKSEYDDCIYVPDKQSTARAVMEKCIDAACRSVMIEAATGSQAATVMAMRNAYDSACELHDGLLLQINRIRQGSVTSDVLETSSRAKEE